MLASQLLLSSWNKHCSLNTASLDIIVIWLWTNEGSRAGSANERPGVADQLSSHCVLLLLSDNKLSVNQHQLLFRESTLSCHQCSGSVRSAWSAVWPLGRSCCEILVWEVTLPLFVDSDFVNTGDLLFCKLYYSPVINNFCFLSKQWICLKSWR